MQKSWILVAWINDAKPSFLLWLRLRRLVVFGKGIWGCSRCNSAMDFFWVVKLPSRLHDVQMWRVLFQIPFNGTLYEFKGSSPLVFVSFCDLSVTTFLRRRLFQDIDIFFKMAGSGLAPASEDVHSFTVLSSGSKDYICLFTATELRSCIASFETTGNLETCTFLR